MLVEEGEKLLIFLKSAGTFLAKRSEFKEEAASSWEEDSGLASGRAVICLIIDAVLDL